MVNADVAEIVWLMVITSCVMVSTLNMIGSRSDMVRVAKEVEGGSTVPKVRRFMVKAIYASNRIILTAKALILFAAVWSTLTPPPPPDIWTMPQPRNNLVTWICVSLVLTVHAIMSMRWRHMLSIGDYGDGVEEHNRRATDQVIVQKIDVIESRTASIDEKATKIEEAVTQNGTTTNGKRHDAGQ